MRKRLMSATALLVAVAATTMVQAKCVYGCPTSQYTAGAAAGTGGAINEGATFGRHGLVRSVTGKELSAYSDSHVSPWGSDTVAGAKVRVWTAGEAISTDFGFGPRAAGTREWGEVSAKTKAETINLRGLR